MNTPTKEEGRPLVIGCKIKAAIGSFMRKAIRNSELLQEIEEVHRLGTNSNFDLDMRYLP